MWISISRLGAFASGPGFRSRAQLDEHYAKHGSEFGNISEPDYLRLAQELRDTPRLRAVLILEARRPNGEFSRFDRRHGYFGAYNPDRTIRTFFIPTTANVISAGSRDGAMTDEEIADYFRENGYPEHVVRAGRTGLIDRWRKFVEEVESGYKSGWRITGTIGSTRVFSGCWA